MPMNSFWRKKFAWSNSRHGMWKECKKQYYFHYIKIYDGLPNDPGKQLLWDLRQMQKLVFLKGRLIHKAIMEQISAQGKINEEATLSFFSKNLDSNLLSKNQIAEIYNKFPPSEEELVQMRLDGQEQLRTFCRNVWPSYNEHKYLEHEKLTKFSLDGIDVWLALDLLTEKDGIYIITDWKTGREGFEDIDDSIQLGLYILWAHITKGIPLEKIKGELVYLKTVSTQSTARSTEQIAALRDFIKKDSAEMLAVSSEADFPAAPLKRKCIGCNFLSLCEEGKASVR